MSEVQGQLEINLAKIGRTADVVCLVRGAEESDPAFTDMLNAALLDTGKAVLVTPSGHKVQPFQSVAIAWNGSREAARAVALAMPMLEVAKTVTILAGTSDYLTPEDVTAFADSLKWHGVNAQTRLLSAKTDDLADHLQAQALDAGAQVLVLGAYSHSRLREFVFGGVTDDIIRGSQMPVLMAH
ncbi:MAG: universal stress protein [Proteobacteria bacterium]|nr:universal stress protein [Pseudomonadota bacterium]MDA1309127.1 universal stress protein [Pseudomonadota bacterium]